MFFLIQKSLKIIDEITIIFSAKWYTDTFKVKRHTHPWVDAVKAQVLVARCENAVWVILEYHNLVGVLLDNIGEFT